MENFTEDIDRYIEKFSRVLDSISRKEIWGALNLLLEALSRGSKIFVISENAAVSEHIELILNRCRFRRTDKRFNCQSMCQNLGNLTDVTANNYDNVFSSQLEGMLKKNDLLIAVSYGSKKNIIKAAEYSKICGCKILSITGGHSERLPVLSNSNIFILENEREIVYSVSKTLIDSIVHITKKILGVPDDHLLNLV